LAKTVPFACTSTQVSSARRGDLTYLQYQSSRQGTCLEGRHILDNCLPFAGLVKTAGILNIVGESLFRSAEIAFHP
jgi:hypothetical protein